MVKGDNILKREAFLFGSLGHFLQIVFFFFSFPSILMYVPISFFPSLPPFPLLLDVSFYSCFDSSWSTVHWNTRILCSYQSKNEVEGFGGENILPHVHTQGHAKFLRAQPISCITLRHSNHWKSPVQLVNVSRSHLCDATLWLGMVKAVIVTATPDTLAVFL